MKKIIGIGIVSLMSFISLPVGASTVTIDEDKVTVENNRALQTTTTAADTVVVQKTPVAYVTTRDPREIEGEIIRVDYPENEIVVRDIDGREKRVLMKQGMISSYKVDDYVKIYLMADMREAKTIETRHTADIDGKVVNIDYANNRVVVRNGQGVDSVVIFQPGLMQKYKPGDEVRLYVVTDYNELQEAKIIRVR